VRSPFCRCLKAAFLKNIKKGVIEGAYGKTLLQSLCTATGRVSVGRRERQARTTVQNGLCNLIQPCVYVCVCVCVCVCVEVVLSF
jgi:hypothetical protein